MDRTGIFITLLKTILITNPQITVTFSNNSNNPGSISTNFDTENR